MNRISDYLRYLEAKINSEKTENINLLKEKMKIKREIIQLNSEIEENKEIKVDENKENKNIDNKEIKLDNIKDIKLEENKHIKLDDKTESKLDDKRKNF